MLDVYRVPLPDGFLLILAPDVASHAGEVKLTRALHRASRSTKRAVLVDCSLVEGLTEEAVELLLAYACSLRAQSRRLVLCHVPSAVTRHFLRLDAASRPLLVSSLLDVVHEMGPPD